MSVCVWLSLLPPLHYGDCEDPAKMTDTKMDFVSRHQAPSLRMQMQSSSRMWIKQTAGTDIGPCTSNGSHLLAAVQRRCNSCLAVTAVLLRVRQQQLSCGRAAAELRLHTARVAQLLESCARGTSAGKAGRCAACQARSVRAIDRQTSRVREQDRQKSWEGQEGDDQTACGRARERAAKMCGRCLAVCCGCGGFAGFAFFFWEEF